MTDRLVDRTTRASDPVMSYEAAESVREVRQRHAAVLMLLRDEGPMTDERLVERYLLRAGRAAVPAQTPSGIRTRRAELVRHGLVADSGVKAKTVSGRNAIVWRAVPTTI